MKPRVFLFSLAIIFFAGSATTAFAKPQHDKVVACYVASWARYRNATGKFEIKDLQPELCTHMIYAFAGLDASSWTISSLDPWGDQESNGIGNYRALTALRQKHPHLTVSLAIGGWNEGSKNYSELAKSPERRKIFIDSVVSFLGTYGFNGFDLDWEFPADRGGAPSDKENFVALVKELKEAFRGKRYSLTAAISASLGNIDKGYDIAELSKHLDHIHVMTYDYHTSWERKVLPNSPLRSKDGQSVERTLKYLLDKGAPASKLVMGLAFYGRTFILDNKLSSPNESPLGKSCSQTGFKGPYTGQDGFMGYNEICEELVDKTGNWRRGWDEEASVPYVVQDKHVIIYDDPASIKAKMELAKELNLAGAMVWSIDTDDFYGKCASLHAADSADFPLMRSINAAFIADVVPKPSTPKPNSAEELRSTYVLLWLTFVMYYL